MGQRPQRSTLLHQPKAVVRRPPAHTKDAGNVQVVQVTHSACFLHKYLQQGVVVRFTRVQSERLDRNREALPGGAVNNAKRSTAQNVAENEVSLGNCRLGGGAAGTPAFDDTLPGLVWDQRRGRHRLAGHRIGACQALCSLVGPPLLDAGPFVRAPCDRRNGVPHDRCRNRAVHVGRRRRPLGHGWVFYFKKTQFR